MASRGGPEAPLPPPLEVLAFKKLIVASNKRPLTESQQKFMKRLDSIPSMALQIKETCRSALNLVETGLIGQFTSLWLSPKYVEDWVLRNYIPLVSKGIKSHFVGKGYFVFVFENVEDRSLIFRNGPYFMGPKGIYLNKWTPDFYPA